MVLRMPGSLPATNCEPIPLVLTTTGAAAINVGQSNVGLSLFLALHDRTKVYGAINLAGDDKNRIPVVCMLLFVDRGEFCSMRRGGN